MTLKITKNLSETPIENMREIEKSFLAHMSKNRMETFHKNQEISEQNLRIKKLKSIFELESLNKWIINNLNEDELISFCVSKNLIEELKVTVTKEKDLYNISLSNKKLGNFFADELFSNFVKICGVTNLKDILIYQILLYYKFKSESHEHCLTIDGDLW